MINLSDPKWQSKGLITWRISARLAGLKFCCGNMKNFSPGWNISLDPKYEIVCEKSQENQNAWRQAESSKYANCLSRSLTLCWRSIFKFLELFNSPQWSWNANEAYLSAREMYLHSKKIYPQARRFMLPWQPRAVNLTLSRCSHIPSELWN